MRGIQTQSDKNLPLEWFLDSLGEACLVVTPKGHILAANAAAKALYGADEQSLLGRSFTDLCHEGERCAVDEHLNACGLDAHEFTARQTREDGTSFLGSFTAKRSPVGDTERLTLLVRELEDHLRAVSSELQLHHLMLESALDGVVSHTLHGELLYANTAAQQQWGMTLDEARARGPWGWVAPQMRGNSQRIIAQLREHGSAKFDSVVGDSGAGRYEVYARIVDGPGEPIVVSTIRDVSERIQTEEMIRYLAYHDDLTGLANRTRLQQELFHAVSIANRHRDLLGVAFVDLDNFKPVNDTYGHAIGDDVLREVANRLSGCMRDGDTIARVGGDEFVVVLPRLASAEALDAVAAKLRAEVAKPIHVGGVEIVVTASIGTALHRQGEDAEALLTRADLGMYQSRGVCMDGLGQAG